MCPSFLGYIDFIRLCGKLQQAEVARPILRATLTLHPLKSCFRACGRRDSADASRPAVGHKGLFLFAKRNSPLWNPKEKALDSAPQSMHPSLPMQRQRRKTLRLFNRGKMRLVLDDTFCVYHRWRCCGGNLRICFATPRHAAHQRQRSAMLTKVSIITHYRQ